MTTIFKSRKIPANREYTIGDKGGSQQTVTYPAPTRGLSTAAPRAGSPQGTALVLDNLIPTQSGCKARSGYVEVAERPDTSHEIKALFSYPGTSGVHDVFAASESEVFSVDSVNQTMTSGLSGQTSSDYSTVFMQTAAATRILTAVNGVNAPIQYDGTTWTNPTLSIKAGHATYTFTAAKLSQAWIYNKRMFFVEKDSLVAWYLEDRAISGACTPFDLTSVFGRSSSLLFGTRFSYDSGDGIDDYCVFVTTDGEVALYKGANPDSAATFALVGTFDISRPLGKNAFFSLAGDVIIATQLGLVPLSAVFKRDVSELKLYSFSREIEQDIQEEVMLSNSVSTSKWTLTKSDFHNLAFLKPPRRGQPEGYVYVINLETRAWCRFTGIYAEDFISAGNQVFSCDGISVFEMFKTGKDDGRLITYRMLNGFDDLGLDGRDKKISKVRVNFVVSQPTNVAVTVRQEYDTREGSYPPAFEATQPGAAKFGTAVWGTDRWAGAPERKQYTESQTIVANCNSAAIQVQFASFSAQPIDVEIASMSLAYTAGTIFT